MTTKLPVLISYAYLRDKKDDEVAALLTRPDVEILLDCGAFTIANTGKEEIKLDAYCAWIERWRENLFGYIALDRLGDPVQTDVNLKVMLDRGLKPIPVHVLGDDQARMDELFTYSNLVALGGLKRPHRASAPLSYVKAKMAWAAGRNVHWLGYTRARSVATWRPFSCDSSLFTEGARWGRFNVYLGRGQWETLESSSRKPSPGVRGERGARSIALHGGINERLRRWGFDTDMILNESQWRGYDVGPESVGRRLVPAIPAFSNIEHTLDVRERFGTRIFLASSPSQAAGIYMALDHIRTLR